MNLLFQHKNSIISALLLLITPFIYAPHNKKAQEVATTLFDILEREAEVGYIGEAGVSQIGHALQAADDMMRRLDATDNDLLKGKKAEAIFAALFHDIGHLCAPESTESMDGYGAMNHETIGQDFVDSLGLPQRIGILIASHADAKRYLATTDSHYYENLSPASKATMEFQGGFMTEEEVAQFKNHPDFDMMIILRRCDEAAKIPGKKTRDLNFYKKMFEQYCSTIFN